MASGWSYAHEVRVSGRQMGDLTSLDGLRSGSHVCCVVDSSAPFERWAGACLAEGARRGEKLFRFGPRTGLDAAGQSVPSDLAVTVLDPREAFLAGGPVDPPAMYDMFRGQTATARQQGYTGLRLVADMDWLLAVPPTRTQLAAFELLLDEVVADVGATVVCVYRDRHFDAATIAEMVAVHPVTVGTVRPEPGFRIWNATAGVWHVCGEVDYTNAELFRRAVVTAASGTAALRVLASDLRFIAVAGMEAIIQVALARPDLQLVIEGREEFWRYWRVLDLDRQLPQVRFVPWSSGGPARPSGMDCPATAAEDLR